MYCDLEFKLRHLKKLSLFSIGVKELSEPLVCKDLWCVVDNHNNVLRVLTAHNCKKKLEVDSSHASAINFGTLEEHLI